MPGDLIGPHGALLGVQCLGALVPLKGAWGPNKGPWGL